MREERAYEKMKHTTSCGRSNHRLRKHTPAYEVLPLVYAGTLVVPTIEPVVYWLQIVIAGKPEIVSQFWAS